MLTRLLHRWPGLLLSLLLMVTACSGVVLSVYPALEAARAPSAEATLTVATLAARVQAAHPGLEQIKRSTSGQFSAWWFDGDTPGSALIDPATGRDVASADPDPQRRWLTSLHRSLLLGDGGRMAVAGGALTMLLLAITGAMLVARRTGGWRHWFARLRGPQAGRWHTWTARLVLPGLVLSAATALWMSAETFEWVVIDEPTWGTSKPPSGRTGLPVADMPALQATPAAELRALSFPAPDDPQDVYTLSTHLGSGDVDQGTGTLLAWQPATAWQRWSDTVEMLHTGQGAAVLGLLLGLAALGVPVMAVTGVIMWWAGRQGQGRPRLRDNAPAAQADTVVLVGSEGGSTWGFAATLATALRAAGQRVHVAPMNAFAPAHYRQAQRLLILTATYGDGAPPASAEGFLRRLQRLGTAPGIPLAVLGFGDRSFPAFCAYAHAVDQAARQLGWSQLMPLDTIHRQSSQDFARWGEALSQALGTPLTLDHQAQVPATRALTVQSRRDHGAAVGVPMAILRFALPPVSWWQRLTRQGWARFEAGDLLGIVPVGATVPRLYSLASGARDGFIEIVVRQHEGGLASGQLTSLAPGQTAQGFLRRHPGFHARRGRSPLILIGAGTGVGPLVGFIRANQRHRPISLYFGLRNPDSDYLYRDELQAWQAEGRLTHLSLAVSRGTPPRHVQDALRDEAEHVRTAVRQGATIMVCGGRDMAAGVSDALSDILRPLGLTPAQLKADERYVEDIY